MKPRRARSSSASWRCMSSSARARRASSSLSPPTKRPEKSPAATRRAAASIPVIRRLSRRAANHDAASASSRATAPATRIRREMRPTVSSTSLSGRGEDDDRPDDPAPVGAAEEQGLGRLGHGPLVPGLRPAGRPAADRRVGRDGEAQVADLGRLGRVGLDVGLDRGRRPADVPGHAQEGHAVARGVGRLPDRAVERADVGAREDAVLDRPAVAVGVAREARELLVAQAGLQGRDHAEPDDRDGRQRDGARQERQAVREGAQQRR